MFDSCTFGKHEFGLARMVETGVVASECMQCLRVKRSPAPFSNPKPVAKRTTGEALRSAIGVASVTSIYSGVARRLSARAEETITAKAA